MFTLVTHTDRSQGGACLDGSPAGLYYHEGSAKNKDKFVLYMDSGGFCGGSTLSQTLEDCYKRSFSSLGTTVNYPKQKNMDKMGLISPLEEKNPVFHDWTKVFIIYCDGSEYQGSR